MTESDDLDLLRRYEAEVDELESLPPANVELSALQALALVIDIQIGRNTPDPLLPSAIEGARQIQITFNPQSAIYQMLELGWQQGEANNAA